jgi:hypothetical protein
LAAADSDGGKIMGGKAGVWIDHRGSVIVALTTDGERITNIASHVEKHLERAGDSPLKGSYEPLQVPPDDRRQMALTGELNGYYDLVIAAIRHYDHVLLLGPGEAKGELHKRMGLSKLADRVDAVETADKMTEPQIAARVRAHFGLEAQRK